MNRKIEFGRRPKGDDFDSIGPLRNDDEFEEFGEDDDDEEDEVDEEVDFDKPTFKRDQIWSDYAEDMDFDN